MTLWFSICATEGVRRSASSACLRRVGILRENRREDRATLRMDRWTGRVLFCEGLREPGPGWIMSCPAEALSNRDKRDLLSGPQAFAYLPWPRLQKAWLSQVKIIVHSPAAHSGADLIDCGR